MTDFEKVLAEQSLVHRRSDLENLANAYHSIDEFIRNVLDPLKAEIRRIGETEGHPPEGIVWDVYRRAQNATAGDPDMVPTKWRAFEPSLPFRL
jgi:hypothetical protein